MNSRMKLFPSDFRKHSQALRDHYGPQPWLTVASGPVAEAYRLAGMAPGEFADLLNSQMLERGRLLIHLRRKPLMRLREGFDGHSGAIIDESGVLILHLHFSSGGGYEERRLKSVSGSDMVWTEGASLRLKGEPRSSLLITGTVDRALADVFPDLPRCLRPRSIRMRSLRRAYYEDNTPGAVLVDVAPHWETLALMPEHASRALGLPPQTRLDQIPWMPISHPVRRNPGHRPDPTASSPPASAKAKPALRLVWSK